MNHRLNRLSREYFKHGRFDYHNKANVKVFMGHYHKGILFGLGSKFITRVWKLRISTLDNDHYSIKKYRHYEPSN